MISRELGALERLNRVVRFSAGVGVGGGEGRGPEMGMVFSDQRCLLFPVSDRKTQHWPRVSTPVCVCKKMRKQYWG